MTRMGLADAVFRKFAAELADDPDSAGNADEITQAFEAYAYDRLVQDIRRGASRGAEIEGNELLKKRAKDGDASIA